MAIGILLNHFQTDSIVSISITTQPTTRTYTVNSSGNVTFSFTGAVVQAIYKSGKREVITPTWSPTTSSITDATSSKSVTVTATYESFTATTTMTVKNPLTSIAITTQPTKKIYAKGESFNSSGAVVTATYTNTKTKTVTATWTPSGALNTTGTAITITASYTDDGVTKTATTTVAVRVWIFNHAPVSGYTWQNGFVTYSNMGYANATVWSNSDKQSGNIAEGVAKCAFNASGYSTIYVNVSQRSVNTSNSGNAAVYVYVGTSSQASQNLLGSPTYTKGGKCTSTGLKSFDISSLSGTYYICVGGAMSTGQSYSITVNEVYLV